MDGRLPSIACRVPMANEARPTWLLATCDAGQITIDYVRDILPNSVVLGLYSEDALIFQNQQLAQDTAGKLNKIVSVPGGDRLQPYKHEPPNKPVRPKHSLGGD